MSIVSGNILEHIVVRQLADICEKSCQPDLETPNELTNEEMLRAGFGQQCWRIPTRLGRHSSAWQRHWLETRLVVHWQASHDAVECAGQKWSVDWRKRSLKRLCQSMSVLLRVAEGRRRLAAIATEASVGGTATMPGRRGF